LADLPEAAIREAVINAVMHRDYRRLGKISIDHTAARLSVTSPGPFVRRRDRSQRAHHVVPFTQSAPVIRCSNSGPGGDCRSRRGSNVC
jgi:predicted HTH transcriptional regulator